MKTPTRKWTVSVVDRVESSSGLLNEYLAKSDEFQFHRKHLLNQEPLTEILRLPPDLILIHFCPPDPRAADFARRMKRLRPKLPIVMATAQGDLASWVFSFQAGVDGFFVIPGSLPSFEETLHDAMAHWKPFTKEIQRLLVERIAHMGNLAGLDAGLSRAEREVMVFMSMGYADKEVAELRGTAGGTTHSIKTRIFKKLHVHKTGEAIRLCNQSRPTTPSEIPTNSCMTDKVARSLRLPNPGRSFYARRASRAADNTNH
jgi:DNA-binding NarL/FixJ family response regulator